MNSRSVFLSLAAGLLAGLAFGTPSQASSTLVTAQATLSSFGPTETVSSIDVSFAGAGSFSDLKLGIPTPASGTTISSSGSTVTITPSASAISAYQILGAVFVQFTFVVPVNVSTAETMVWTTGSAFNVGTDPPGVTGVSFSPLTASVPEPTSMSLLGIGMAGFFTYRRLFKRTAAA
jgi:hypothetical protein